MLSIQKISSSGKNRNGVSVLAYLQATEYYLGADGERKATSRFIGKGLEALGLTPGTPIDPVVIERLARGYAPDGTALVQSAGREATEYVDARGKKRVRDGHSVGFDATFSAPKSVSVVWSAASAEEREAITAAHRKAVDCAMAFLESKVEVRTGKGGAVHAATNGVVALSVDHAASRELDPQLHSHCLIFNIAQAETDGKWRTLGPFDLFEHKMAAGALYRAELAHQMQALGYGIELTRGQDLEGRETGKDNFTIAGVSEAAMERFSKRREQIEAHMKEHGTANAQRACLSTRKAKHEPPIDELHQLWSAALKEERERNPEMFKTTEELRGLASKTEERTREQIIERLHVTENVFKQQEVVARLAMEGVGRLSGQQILEQAKAFLEADDLRVLNPMQDRSGRQAASVPARRFREDRFCADWVVEQVEQVVRDIAIARKDETAHHLTPAQANDAIARFEAKAGFQMSDEQSKAVQHILAGSGGVSVMRGEAGTGKTTVASCWAGAFREQGYHVIGTATAWNAAKKFEAETGVEGRSLSKLLDELERGVVKLTPKTIIAVDEAGMVGSRTIKTLMEHCQAAGAPLILVGDEKQLQSIEGGGGLDIVMQAIGCVELTEIRRQKSDYDRGTAKAFYGGDRSLMQDEWTSIGHGIIERMDEANQVHRFDDTKQAIQGLVKHWLGDPEPMSERLIVAGTNSEVRTLNEAVREQLIQRGDLGADEYTFRANQGTTLEHTQPVRVGDRMRFDKRDRQLGVFNGSAGVIEEIRPTAKGSLILAIRLESEIASENGRVVRFDTATMSRLSLNYASTTHKAQGQGKNSVYQLANVGMTDQQMGLVGFTRMKKKYGLYGTHSDIDEMAGRMAMDRMKQNAIQEGFSPEDAKRQGARLTKAGKTPKAQKPPRVQPAPVRMQTPVEQKLEALRKAVRQGQERRGGRAQSATPEHSPIREAWDAVRRVTTQSIRVAVDRVRGRMGLPPMPVGRVPTQDRSEAATIDR